MYIMRWRHITYTSVHILMNSLNDTHIQTHGILVIKYDSFEVKQRHKQHYYKHFAMENNLPVCHSPVQKNSMRTDLYMNSNDQILGVKQSKTS